MTKRRFDLNGRLLVAIVNYAVSLKMAGKLLTTPCIMNSLRAITLAVLVILAASGCAAVNNTMQSWVGHHQSELIASWGPPSSTASDGNGGEILIYQNYLQRGQTPGYIAPAGNGAYYYTAPQQNGYNRSRMFYADSNGIIYNWRWQGL